MKNYIFGYARVSTENQNLDRQLDALKNYGVDMIYNEKMTGTKKRGGILMDIKERLNIEVDNVVIDDVATKVGTIFGENGKLIGKVIDKLTKNITIKIEDSKVDK